MNVSGIHAIGTPPVLQPPGAGAPAGAGRKVDFGQLVRQAVNTIDGDQQASAAGVEALLSGKQDDVLPIVTSVAKADASFKLLIGVRNKMIEAYKQTMQMQL